MSTTSSTLSSALDKMFDRPEGLYGAFDAIPVISQKGHYRRMELLQQLDVGDVTGMVCADFGMGSWGFAAAYPKIHQCARAIGMDISGTAIEMSKKLIREAKPVYFERFEALQSDGMDIPLPDESIDLFFSGESIEHVKFPLRHLSEIYRTLKPGGQLVVTTPNRDAIKYKEAGEEYCTSPEHFWLFNYPELIEVLTVYFDIKESYGFNGSFGSAEEDRAAANDGAVADAWCRQFENEPHLATGLVLRMVKKPDVRARYVIKDIPASDILIEGADTYLPLEFGLKGLLMDKPQAKVSVTRPASDGIVCRFWCHRWSGKAAINAGGVGHSLDLYTAIPGWKNWTSDHRSVGPTSISITPMMERNPKAESDQVLFFEAFTWSVVDSEGNALRSAPAAQTAKLAGPGYGFVRFKPFVGTTVFHWFTPTEGNVRGPWQPVGGRKSWTGQPSFWEDQIKDMMLANIDAIYLHCIDQYEEPRIEFFKAYANLRAQGYDVPKVAPFLDPFYLFRMNPIDVATDAGKDEFARHYIRFFEQYFSQNTDPHAASYLLTVDGKLALSTWWVFGLLRNIDQFTRTDLQSRLIAALGSRIPQLGSGIYMMTTALIDPDLTFSDERTIMFSGYTYALHSVHESVDVWHVQAGYWDENIRKPGYFLPRDGGKNYKRAWNIVAANMPNIHRVYIESWNEYDEGSGIYAADPAGLFIDPMMHSNFDTFSDTNDPYEYIRTTAAGASRVNGRPALAAKILWHDAPMHSSPGMQTDFIVVVRNEGNQEWTEADGIALSVSSATGEECIAFRTDAGARTEARNGAFRGRPVQFPVSLKAPETNGTWMITVTVATMGMTLGLAANIAIDVR